MPATALSQVIGTTRSRKLTAMSGGRAITGTFQSGDALSATVWRGEDQSALFNPTVSWIDAAAGTINLTITAAQLATAAVTAGTYFVKVLVTPTIDGQPRAVHFGTIRFLAGGGSAAAPVVFATWEDMTQYSPQIEKLQDQDTDQTQFAEERAKARAQTIQRIINRYRPVPGRSRRYMDEERLTAGPYLVFAGSPDGSAAPSPTDLAAWLAGIDPATPHLVLNDDIVEFNARYAAALVYGAQPGRDNAYQQQAGTDYRLAESAWNRAMIEIDTDGDGAADIRVDRDVIYLT
jgi:hypothetical protein